MEEACNREQQLVQNLEQEKEIYRQQLEDAIENNRAYKSLNAALRLDIQNAKNKMQRLSYRRNSTRLEGNTKVE